MAFPKGYVAVLPDALSTADILVDAALHHGGAGTVGASLRAGIPTLIKPWFGDQFFWYVSLIALRGYLLTCQGKQGDETRSRTQGPISPFGRYRLVSPQSNDQYTHD